MLCLNLSLKLPFDIVRTSARMSNINFPTPEFIEMLSHITPSNIERVEKMVANVVAEQSLTPTTTRSKVWKPIVGWLLGRCFHRSISSDDGRRDGEILDIPLANRVLVTVEESILRNELYNRSNLPMEILREGVFTRNPRFNSDIFRAAALIYDPFLEGVMAPSIQSLHRILLDTNSALLDLPEIMRAEEGSPSSSGASGVGGTGGKGGTRGVNKKERVLSGTGMAIPQEVPGIGGMIADVRIPASNADGLRDHILRSFDPNYTQSGRTKPSPSTDSNASEIREWFRMLASEVKGRILIINLSYNLPSPRSLIKYRLNSIPAEVKMRSSVITKEVIEETFPFTFPPKELPREGVFKDDIPGNETPYYMFGKYGPMFMVLDYGYGVDRYLLLRSSANSIPLDSSVTIEKIKELQLKSVNRDLHVLHAIQHFTFIAYYIPQFISIRQTEEDADLPTFFDETIGSVDRKIKSEKEGMAVSVTSLPSRGSYRFIYETYLPEGDPKRTTEMREKAITSITKYMQEFARSITLRWPDGIPSKIKNVGDRLHQAYLVMYIEKVTRAIDRDMVEGVELFSPHSASRLVVVAFEDHYFTFAKSER